MNIFKISEYRVSFIQTIDLSWVLDTQILESIYGRSDRRSGGDRKNNGTVVPSRSIWRHTAPTSDWKLIDKYSGGVGYYSICTSCLTRFLNKRSSGLFDFVDFQRWVGRFSKLRRVTGIWNWEGRRNGSERWVGMTSRTISFFYPTDPFSVTKCGHPRLP